MTMIFRSLALGLSVLLVAAAPARREPATAAAARPMAQPVVLRAQPNTALDRTARELVAQDLAEAAQRGDKPLLLVGSAPLAARPAGGDRPALFVQLQSARECGSAGCSTSAYRFDRGNWALVLDAVSGTIVVDTQVHRGMHDLILHDTDRWVWNGTAYVDPRQVTPVAIAPKPRATAKRH